MTVLPQGAGYGVGEYYMPLCLMQRSDSFSISSGWYEYPLCFKYIRTQTRNTGIGFFFSGFMILLTAIQARYTPFSPKNSEEFSTASRSVK
jgi:hypothetical protein